MNSTGAGTVMSMSGLHPQHLAETYPQRNGTVRYNESLRFVASLLLFIVAGAGHLDGSQVPTLETCKTKGFSEGV